MEEAEAIFISSQEIYEKKNDSCAYVENTCPTVSTVTLQL